MGIELLAIELLPFGSFSLGHFPFAKTGGFLVQMLLDDAMTTYEGKFFQLKSQANSGSRFVSGT